MFYQNISTTVDVKRLRRGLLPVYTALWPHHPNAKPNAIFNGHFLSSAIAQAQALLCKKSGAPTDFISSRKPKVEVRKFMKFP